MHYYGPEAKKERYDADGYTVHDYQEAFSEMFTHTSTEWHPGTRSPRTAGGSRAWRPPR
jgi:hypothetical protein